MKITSAFRFVLPALAAVALLSSCEKDEGKLPNISFKTGGNYVSGDVTRHHGDTIVIGINSSKAEDKDPLKKFSVSKFINGGSGTTPYTRDLSGSEGDNFSYDYTAILEPDTTKNQVETYTFSVTNRDGLLNQISVKVTVQ